MSGANYLQLLQITTNLIQTQLSTIKSQDVSQSSFYMHNYIHYWIIKFVESSVSNFYLHLCSLVFFFSFVYVQPTENVVLLYQHRYRTTQWNNKKPWTISVARYIVNTWSYNWNLVYNLFNNIAFCISICSRDRRTGHTCFLSKSYKSIVSGFPVLFLAQWTELIK